MLYNTPFSNATLSNKRWKRNHDKVDINTGSLDHLAVESLVSLDQLEALHAAESLVPPRQLARLIRGAGNFTYTLRSLLTTTPEHFTAGIEWFHVACVRHQGVERRLHVRSTGCDGRG